MKNAETGNGAGHPNFFEHPIEHWRSRHRRAVGAVERYERDHPGGALLENELTRRGVLFTAGVIGGAAVGERLARRETVEDQRVKDFKEFHGLVTDHTALLYLPPYIADSVSDLPAAGVDAFLKAHFTVTEDTSLEAEGKSRTYHLSMPRSIKYPFVATADDSLPTITAVHTKNETGDTEGEYLEITAHFGFTMQEGLTFATAAHADEEDFEPLDQGGMEFIVLGSVRDATTLDYNWQWWSKSVGPSTDSRIVTGYDINYNDPPGMRRTATVDDRGKFEFRVRKSKKIDY